MPHWVTVREAASYFSMNAKTLYSLATRNRLPEGTVLRLGRALRLDVEKIEAEAVKNNEGRQGAVGSPSPYPIRPERLHLKGDGYAKK